jgi:EmrB/QacA subfamily drug resistance transporter
LALAVVVTAAFLGTLDLFIVNLALPAIQTGLNASFAQVQLVMAGCSMAYAVCLITGGRLGDIFGRKRVFLLGMAGFTLTSALCGLAPSPEALIAARVLRGLAGALTSSQVLAIIQVTFPAEERGRAFGVYGMVQGAASLTGIMLGGLLVQSNLFGLSWRPIFLVQLPVGALTFFGGLVLIRESRSPSAKRLDLGGVALSSVALFLLVYPLIKGREAGWPAWAFACLAGAPVVLAVFAFHERRVLKRCGSPLVELALFRNRAFVVGLATTLAFCSGLSAFYLTVTLFLQRGLGASPTAASLAFAPFAVGYLLASGTAGRLSNRVLPVGAATMTVALSWLILLAQVKGQALTVVELMPVLLVYGVGQGLVFPRLISAALSRVRVADAGSASGVLTTVQQVAYSLGVAVIGSVFFSVLGHGAAPEPHAAALSAALLCNVVLLLLTFLLTVRLRRLPVAEKAPAVARA